MKQRKAFTLVELLVAVAVILVLLGITLLFWPKRDSRITDDTASAIQSYIAGAKSRALRDNRQIGIRFLSNDNGNTFYGMQVLDVGSRLAPIQPNMSLPQNQWTIYLDLPAGSGIKHPHQNIAKQVGVPLQGNVEIGDWLEIVEVTQSIHKIVAIDYQTNVMTLAASQSYETDGNGNPDLSRPLCIGVPNVNCCPSARLGNNYRYIRKPRPLIGEQIYQFPKDIIVMGNGSIAPSSLNLPTGSTGQYDLLFSPSGQMINSSGGKTVLWITDTNLKLNPTLLVIWPATGNCAPVPVGSVGNEYQFVSTGY